MKSSANIFENIPDNLDQELFETLAEKGDLKIERITSKGHTSPESGWYDQAHDEWVMVLKGSGTLSFENGESVTLNGGDYLQIPAHHKHKVTWTDPDIQTIWLAIHF